MSRRRFSHSISLTYFWLLKFIMRCYSNIRPKFLKIVELTYVHMNGHMEMIAGPSTCSKLLSSLRFCTAPHKHSINHEWSARASFYYDIVISKETSLTWLIPVLCLLGLDSMLMKFRSSTANGSLCRLILNMIWLSNNLFGGLLTDFSGIYCASLLCFMNHEDSSSH